MQVVAARPQRLEDQLVLEQPRRFAVQLAKDREQPGMAGELGARGRDVNDRVERLKQALAIVAVRLPATAKIAGVDQILAIHEAIGLGQGGGDLVGKKDPTDQKEALLVVCLALGGSE
jgi:hypothetical protein